MGQLDELIKALDGMELERGLPMRQLTTFRLGGPADAVLFVKTEAGLLKALLACREHALPYHIIGNGSNLIVRDGGLRGLVLVIGKHMAGFSQKGTQIIAGAGLSLTALARETVRLGLMGLEWACGIPGTLGGACAMNAGAYTGELKQSLKCVRILENYAIYERDVEPCDLGYRTSIYGAPDKIVLSAMLELSEDDGFAKKRQADYLCSRETKQPLAFASAGSVFKRPKGHYAGQLIEAAGLKGARCGGAMVSDLHAGFIINTGDATASDVLGLIERVRKAVLETSGVELELEVKVWGDG